jgi:hypothetical protein
MKRGLLLLFALAAVAVGSAPRSIVWMCLERCNDSPADGLAEIARNKRLLTGVSYEQYDLGPGQLVDNGFTDVGPAIAAMGLERWPMITTANNSLLLELFWGPDHASPPVLQQAVAVAVAKNLTGFDLDFEPDDDMREIDAVRYVRFLDMFAAALHAEGKRLSVDVASWNHLWNFTLLAGSRVDMIHQMDTYCCNDNFTEWQNVFARSAAVFPARMLSVGLITEMPQLDQANLTMRLKYLTAHNISSAAYWKLPMPQAYWDAIAAW